MEFKSGRGFKGSGVWIIRLPALSLSLGRPEALALELACQFGGGDELAGNLTALSIIRLPIICERSVRDGRPTDSLQWNIQLIPTSDGERYGLLVKHERQPSMSLRQAG